MCPSETLPNPSLVSFDHGIHPIHDVHCSYDINMAMLALSMTGPAARSRAASSEAHKHPRSARFASVKTRALGDSGEDRPKLTRENEPEEYWVSEREKAGKSAFSDPVAIIGILAILFPIILLLILSALGVVDLTPQ